MSATASPKTTSAAERPRHQRVLQESGPAAGRISGINHLVLFVWDMDEAVRFYRDLLGLRVVRTLQFTNSAEGLRSAALHSRGSAATAPSGSSSVAPTMKLRQVFFEMGNGELFSLYATPAVSKRPAAPVSSVLWPTVDTEQWDEPREPQKLDHLSFDVPTQADLEWFRTHLLAHGVAVSDITERRGANNAHRFISSFYFSDPSGNPLELATFDGSDVTWRSYDFGDWFMDADPVPSLVEGPSSQAMAFVPRWIRSPAK